jgi:hypothetical protein
VFDNSFTGKVLHNNGSTNPDFATGQIAPTITEYEVDGCIFRNSAVRNSSSQRQIGARDIAITNDEFNMADKVVEVPREGVIVREGDTFVDEDENKWHITAVDICTLDTRYRLALKAFA